MNQCLIGIINRVIVHEPEHRDEGIEAAVLGRGPRAQGDAIEAGLSQLIEQSLILGRKLARQAALKAAQKGVLLSLDRLMLCLPSVRSSEPRAEDWSARSSS